MGWKFTAEDRRVFHVTVFPLEERLIVPNTAFINGRFLPLAEASVSIEDRGFQFGDGVYEVIRTYRGRPFKLDAHLARLHRSAGP